MAGLPKLARYVNRAPPSGVATITVAAARAPVKARRAIRRTPIAIAGFNRHSSASPPVATAISSSPATKPPCRFAHRAKITSVAGTAQCNREKAGRSGWRRSQAITRIATSREKPSTLNPAARGCTITHSPGQ
jgi:hypothetical protein